MAAKKTPSKKTGLVKRKAMSAAEIKAQAERDLAALKDKTEVGEGRSISTRGKVFTLPDGQVIQPPMDVVIVDFVSRNLYYDTKYDPDNPQPPACMAVGDSPKGLIPVKDAPDVQHSDCDTCPLNQFGSDGDGKACKNTRYLAVVMPDDVEGNLMTLSVPPTGTRPFDAYVNSVAKLYSLPPVGVVTQVSFHEEKSYPLPLFGDPRPNENVGLHYALREDAKELLYQLPDFSTAEAKPKKKSRRRA